MITQVFFAPPTIDGARTDFNITIDGNYTIDGFHLMEDNAIKYPKGFEICDSFNRSSFEAEIRYRYELFLEPPKEKIDPCFIDYADLL